MAQICHACGDLCRDPYGPPIGAKFRSKCVRPWETLACTLIHEQCAFAKGTSSHYFSVYYAPVRTNRPPHVRNSASYLTAAADCGHPMRGSTPHALRGQCVAPHRFARLGARPAGPARATVAATRWGCADCE